MKLDDKNLGANWLRRNGMGANRGTPNEIIFHNYNIDRLIRLNLFYNVVQFYCMRLQITSFILLKGN